jgi:hypothetical protein
MREKTGSLSSRAFMAIMAIMAEPIPLRSGPMAAKFQKSLK